MLALLSPHHQRIDDGLLRSLSDRRAPARRSQESQGSLPSRELVRIGSSFIRNPSAASAPTCHLAGIPSPRNPIRSGADPRQSGSRNRRCVPVASDCGIEFGSEIAGALRRDRVCLLLDGLGGTHPRCGPFCQHHLRHYIRTDSVAFVVGIHGSLPGSFPGTRGRCDSRVRCAHHRARVAKRPATDSMDSDASIRHHCAQPSDFAELGEEN